MKIRKHGEEERRPELQMTSMIDIVFLLLVFFVMTFKIVEMEGDFNVRMPLADASQAQSTDLQVPLNLRLTADGEGNLQGIQLNDVSLPNFDQLQQTVIGLVGEGAGADEEDGPEVEIDTDYNLRYEHVIEAITAVSGHVVNGEPVKLIEKIKFAPPRG